jgi:GAF domain-containing protein
MKNSFGINLIAEEEEARLAALYRYEILDTVAEGPFDRVAAFAAARFQVPIAVVSLVDKYRVWYKAALGLGNLREVPRGDSLCSLVVLNEAATVFRDALEEPCLLANPFVAGEFGLRFFAGAPIKTTDGYKIGAVSIIDKIPREFTPQQQADLQNLAAFVMEEIRLRLCQMAIG